MSAVTVLSSARPLTRRDLDDLPEDGRRYELIDGVLVVSPSPALVHQGVVGNLHLLLRAACPPELRVVLAPFAVALAEDTELQPDLLVSPRDQFTQKELPGAPLLAVEVLSPSTRRIDLLLKRDRLQEAGAASYWLVDPVTPSITVLELQHGTYVEVTRAEGDEVVELVRPFPVRVVPSALPD